MKVFIISVVMWWADPALIPNTDAVEVHTLHGKSLFFKTRADCFEHIDQNLEALKKEFKMLKSKPHILKNKRGGVIINIDYRKKKKGLFT